MNIILIKAIQLLLCLSLLVVLHEGGHFGFAKLFKTRVTRFYLFANWGFHLFSTYDNWFRRLCGKPLVTQRGKEGQNLFAWIRNTYYRLTGQKDKIQTENIGNKKYDDSVGTEYGIGWLPIGGYVAIAGMIDETNQKLEGEAQPWEFRSKKVWQRFLIMVGGVLMNLITAFVIYCGIMLVVGEDRLPMQNIKQGFVYNEEAEALGFRDGDIPVRIDGEEIRGWSASVIQDISTAKTVSVLRNGKETSLSMPEDGINLLQMLRSVPPFMMVASPMVVDSVAEGSAVAKAGMVKGSRILAVDGTEVHYWSDYDSLFVRKQDVLASNSCTLADSLRLRKMTLVFQNPDAAQPDTVAIQLDEEYRMGVYRHNIITDYTVNHIDYNLLTCIPAGMRLGWNTLANYVGSLKYVATKDGAQEVGSFIAIGDMFPETWNWLRFWTMTALISIVLAVMNILPIPGLDGGHVVVLLYEAITGRQPSERVMVWLEYIGMGLLIALMILAFGNDIRRFIL
ncbi:MAG: RIP metalloprotease RseP [Bacteroidaceae bacterium]|nr:RIP metalloprotease RseP [Bacteroidaceae bacterium]